jgi:hypothetical protein
VNPTHVYIAYKPCGCWSAMITEMLDNLDDRIQTAESVANCIVYGDRVERVDFDTYRAQSGDFFSSCPNCSKYELPVIAEEPGSVYHVKGEIEYKVTIGIDMRVRAASEDKAFSVVTNAYAPISLLTDDVSWEWDDEELTAKKLEPHEEPGPWSQQPLI